MKHLNAYKLFENQSNDENKEFISELIDILSEIHDDGYKIVIESQLVRLLYTDLVDRNEKYEEFRPIFKIGNKIRGRFKIRIYKNLGNYDKFTKLITEMYTSIARIGDLNWFLDDFVVGKSKSVVGNVIFDYIEYSFFRRDKIIKDEEFKIDYDKIIEAFKEYGLSTKKDDIENGDNYVLVPFESFSYDGKIPNDIKKYLEEIKYILGFNSFEYEQNYDYEGYVKFWID